MKTRAAVAAAVAVVATAAVVVTVVVITAGDVDVVAGVVGRSDASAFVELVLSGFFGLVADRGDAIFADVAVMRDLSIFNQRRPTGTGRGGGSVLMDAGTNGPDLSHEVAVQRNERVESVVTLEIREIRQHVKGVQVDQQILVMTRSTMADSSGSAGSLESDFVTQIGRQSALDVIVRQIQRLVEQAFRLQPTALTEELIR